MRYLKSSLQENGQITLPVSWRRKYNLQKGDEVVLQETPEGLVVGPKLSQMLQSLGKIGQDLKTKKITQAEMVKQGRSVRGELLEKLYGISQK